MSDQQRKPQWLRRPPARGAQVHRLRSILRSHGLHTVCESARCPNISECFAQPTATFLIMGDRCTRNCAFCAIEHGAPLPLDQHEPEQLALVAAEMGLTHVVVTSVTRDDLHDGGAAHFLAVCRAIRGRLPQATIEVLVPDMLGNEEAVALVANGPIEVFNHNLETLPRLYGRVRPQADYARSLQVLRLAKQARPELATKSGLMVGLGETREEIEAVLDDLRNVDCDMITVGQYLRPRLGNLAVERYWEPAEFDELQQLALSKGFKQAFCAPLVRSSYHARPLSD
ncbi:MAG: lipoyl synthase [Candidatus Alcyoniella australis]|nr:lipoyl synthase [Candidatus Alcyoniella australis]